MDLLAVLEDLRSCRWVDLTHTFAPGMPHYAGFPDEQRELVFDYPQGFRAEVYRHVGQWGTHMDPPSHFVDGARTQDAVPVTEMILPLVVLDVRDRAAADPDLAVGADVIREHEARFGPIPTRAFVALLTGWAERWPEVDAAHHPGWGVDALELLVGERAITAIGHDVTDTDPGALVLRGESPAELYILQADRWQIELLAGLEEVPPRGALVVATWPKPKGGSGFPARVFALVPPAGSTGV
jgi:kynurenine formamidase